MQRDIADGDYILITACDSSQSDRPMNDGDVFRCAVGPVGVATLLACHCGLTTI